MATKDSSITDDAARKFLKDAPERGTLWCDKQTGLHLLKTRTGGSWRYRYTDATGKRRTATVGRYPAMKPQQAAETVMAWRADDADPLKEKADKREAALTAEQQAEARNFNRYIEGPFTRYQDRRTAGGETLAIIRNNFADWMDRDMATLTRADVVAWQSRREKEGRAHATLKRAYGAVKTMLNQAVRDGVLEEHPLRHVPLEKPPETDRSRALEARREATRRLLSDDELANFHDGLDAFSEEIRDQRRSSRAHGKPSLPDLDAVAYPHWFIPFAKVSLFTGLRPGDLYTLTWAELNANFGRLVKTPQKTRHHPSPVRVEMDLPAQALEVVRAWWEQQGKPTSGIVFPSPITGKRLDKKAHGKPWRRVKRLGHLPEGLTFYALRHHFISTLVASGVPLLTVAQLAGHKSAAMIESHYGHLCPTAARDIMANYGAAVAAKPREAAG